MKTKSIITLILLSVLMVAKAQWSNDPLVNNIVCDLSGDQAVPHVAYDATGNFYVGFYSNDNGNYDIRLQYYNFGGVAQWADDGILISNHSQNSWVTDWDLTVDNSGNCVLAFNDVRDGNANVYAYAISPSGSMLWGADGIQLTSDSQDEFVPSITVTGSNNTIVAWSRPTTGENVIVMQKITPAGTLSWGSSGIIYSGAQSYTGARVLGISGDNYLMGFYKETGNFPALTRHIYVQKFDGNGSTVWTSDVLASSSNGISAFTNFTIASDGANGIVLAWMDDRNSDNNIDAAVQRVLSDGSITWPTNGSTCMMSTNNSNQNPQILGVNSNNETLVCWSKKNGNQSQTAIAGQKFSDTGSPLWGNDGIEFIAMSPDVSGVIGGSVYDNTNALITYEEWVSGSSVHSHIKALGVDDNGGLIWTPNSTLMAGRTTEKVHSISSPMYNDMLVVVWEEGSSKDIYMQNVYSDGSIGDPPLGDDASLSDLTVDGTTVDGFHPDTLTYDVGIPAGNPLPVTGATPVDPDATVLITQASSVPGSSSVTVTAEDGVTQQIYNISFHVAGTDATLSDLTVNGVTITGFSPNTFNYDYSVATGMPIPVIDGTPTDPYADTTVTQATTLPGAGTIVVVSEDGLTTNTYTVNFLYTPGTDATLADLLVGGVSIEGFDPNTLDYTYNVVYPNPAPYVEGIPNDTLATVDDTQCLSIPGDAILVVTAEDGVTTLTYTVSFSYLGWDATLSDLTVDGITIPGFDPNITNYQYGVADISPIPVVDGTTNDPLALLTVTQATEIPGDATLLVTAEDGVTQLTYTVHFFLLGSDATLSDLTVDGVTISDFDPLVTDYDYNVSEGQPVPVINGTPNDPEADTSVIQATSVPGNGSITVTAQDGTTQMVYTVNFKLITGIENSTAHGLFVYPNPAGKYIHIGGVENEFKYRILNTTGNIVEMGHSALNNLIHVEFVNPGVYAIEVIQDDKVNMLKFIKQ